MGRVLCLFVVSLFSVGCQSPVTTPLAPARGVATLPTLTVGQDCVVTLVTESPGTTLMYEGKIKAADGESIVLAKPTRTIRQQQSPPVLGRVPYLRRQFSNVGIGRENLRTDLTVDRVDIADVQILSQDSALSDQTAAERTADTRSGSASAGAAQ